MPSSGAMGALSNGSKMKPEPTAMPAEARRRGAYAQIVGWGMHVPSRVVRNDSFVDYRLPTIADVPRSIETIFIEDHPAPTGPHGAKAIGELANNSTPAAIANAVADAVGARVFELPLTAERVHAALIHAGAQPDPLASQ